MKLIQRDQYLEKIISVMGTPDIKVITGVRIVDISDWLLPSDLIPAQTYQG